MCNVLLRGAMSTVVSEAEILCKKNHKSIMTGNWVRKVGNVSYIESLLSYGC